MTYSIRACRLLSDCAEGNVQDGVLAPVLVIVMPPFVWFDGETFSFDDTAKQVPPGARFGRTTGVVGIRARGHLVVVPWHLYGLAGGEVVHREIDRAAAIVLRSGFRIGNELALKSRRHVPEQLGDRPRTV